MEPLTFVIVAVGVAVLLWRRLVSGREQEDDERWGQFAARRRLDYRRTPQGRHASGRVGDAEVEIDEYFFTDSAVGWGTRLAPQSAERDGTKIRVWRPGGLPESLSIRADSGLRALGRTLGGEDHDVGDERFDRALEIAGSRAHALALASAEARRALHRFVVGLDGRVERGALVWHARASTPGAERVAQVLDEMLALSRGLSLREGELCGRLSHNARHDPKAGVRLACFEALARVAGPSSQPLTDAARALLADRHAPLRLAAAQSLGAEGLPTLVELCSDATLAAPGRAAALDAIAARDPDQALPLLAEARTSDEAELRRAAAEALGRLAPAPAQGWLVALLEDAEAAVRQAAANALGQAGGVAAVEPLLALAEGREASGEVRAAARDAVRRLQSRLGRADAGWVSLSRGERTGGLSLPLDPKGGQVDVAETAEATETTETPESRGTRGSERR